MSGAARRMALCACAAALSGVALYAVPIWRAPAQIPIGELVAIEIVETDPAQPPMPRPAEDRLGLFALRSALPIENGRGWRLTIQALRPGVVVVPPIDLGQGRLCPELKIQVVRTVPLGAPWMGLGGGDVDLPPTVGFPWGWAALGLLPLGLLIYFAVWLWRKTAPNRRFARARRGFAAVWPPRSMERGTIEKVNAKGRELLASAWGEEARSWGRREFLARQNAPWASWCGFMDKVRFGGAAGTRNVPPTLSELIEAVGNRR